MANRVYITGCGIISSIGDNVNETFSSILEEKTGIGKIDLLNTNHKDHLIAGEIKHTNEELAKMTGSSTYRWNYPDYFAWYHRCKGGNCTSQP